MLYVEKDLSAIVKAVLDAWPERRDELKWKYLHASDARLTPADIVRAAEKGESVLQSLDKSNAVLNLSPVSLWQEV